MATLIAGWGPVIRSIEVIPGTGGVFTIDINGLQVFTKSMLGRYPKPEDVVSLIRDAIGPEVSARR